MKKYLIVIKTTFNDSIQYASTILFRFIGFAITMSILLSLWTFIYKDGSGVINGYTLNQMMWYLLLAEVITYGCGSKVATDEITNIIKSGNIAYQVTKPYNFIGYIICKYMADTFIRFFLYAIVSIILGLIFVGPIVGLNIITILSAIPIFILALLLSGMIRILISLLSFWVEESRPFQLVYNKFVLIFGVFFPLEMFSKPIQKIIRLSPIYGVSYGPAKLVLSFTGKLFSSVLLSQLVSILIVAILIEIIYRIGVKKINVNGG